MTQCSVCEYGTTQQYDFECYIREKMKMKQQCTYIPFKKVPILKIQINQKIVKIDDIDSPNLNLQ